MSKAPRKGGYVSQAWLVIVLALLYGGALAGVQTTLGPRIAENKKSETYDVIPHLVEGAARAKTTERTVTGAVDGKPHPVYRAVTGDGTLCGWALPATGLGFADRIDLLIGLCADASTITGIYVLEQKETPGLGNLIGTDEFRGQFAGKRADEPIQVVTAGPVAGNEIRALTGATISCDSVADIVNATVENLREPIRQLGAQEPLEPNDVPRGRGG
ncbi:MAG: FMN-binding protein [Pirellulales bacterium]|nr:FMN-binding protein [Pirellulales bacterium]